MSALVPMFINARTGAFNTGSTITLGARGDSYYEYLLKQWLLTGKRDGFYRDVYNEVCYECTVLWCMYMQIQSCTHISPPQKKLNKTHTHHQPNATKQAIAAIRAKLLRHSEPRGLAYIAELQNGRTFSPKMDHLVCYLPGTLALGAHHGLDECVAWWCYVIGLFVFVCMDGGGTTTPARVYPHPPFIRPPPPTPPNHHHHHKPPYPKNKHDTHHRSHLAMAKDLMASCFAFYNSTATGLAPEIAYFTASHPDAEAHPEFDLYIQPRDTHNILRPETVESLFYLWRVTKDPVYREWGWRIFAAFERHSKVGGWGACYPVSVRIDRPDPILESRRLLMYQPKQSHEHYQR